MLTWQDSTWGLGIACPRRMGSRPPPTPCTSVPLVQTLFQHEDLFTKFSSRTSTNILSFLFWSLIKHALGFPGGSAVKNPLVRQETQETGVRSLGQEDPLEESMTTHSCILTWRIPWTKEPCRLQSIQSQSWTRLKQLNTHLEGL